MAKYEYKWRYMYESCAVQAAGLFFTGLATAWKTPGRSGPSAAVTSDGGDWGEMDGWMA